MWTLALALFVTQQAADANETFESENENDIAAGDEEMFALEEEMVSTASRASEPIRKAPASVTVITERELRAFDYTNVADALRGVRGLYLTDDRLYTSLGVRGFNRFGDYGNRVQVQLDGHVMNDDWIFSSYIGNDQFTDIHHIESIEVVRGPGSALYGTGAFFGIVNLKTPRRASPYTIRLGGGLVDQSTMRLHVDAGVDLTPLTGTEAGMWVSAGGSALPGRDYASASMIGTPWASDGIARGVDAFSTATTTGKVWYGDFTLAYAMHQRDRRFPTGHYGTAFGDRRNIFTDNRAFAELRYEPVLSSWLQLSSRLYVDHQGYYGSFASTDPEAFLELESNEGNWGGAEVRAQITPLAAPEDLRVITGVQYELHPLNRWGGRLTPTAEPYQDQSSVFHYFSAYAVADWQPFTWLLLSGGARFDGWVLGSGSTYGEPPATDAVAFIPSLNPRLALIWMPSDEDTLKLMGGRAYRIPSTYEMTYSVTGLDLTEGAALGSETIYTSELEYRRRLADHTHLIGSVFANSVTDLITYLGPDEAPADTGEAFYNVVQPLYTIGAELEVRQDLPHGILAAGQVSVQRTRVGDVFEGDPIPNSPEQLWSAWLVVPLVDGASSTSWKATSLELAQRINYDRGRLDRTLAEVPAAFTWDAMLTGRFAELPVSFTVGLKNVLDNKNVNPVSDDVLETTLPLEGRSLRAEVFAWF